jgi:predicted nucleic acid-binding protein
LVEEELLSAFDENQIIKILSIVPDELLIKVEVKEEQLKEAIKTGKRLNLPVKDALHAIMARDNHAILISRDKHFYELSEQMTIKKPEDLI